jgi:hypothetical protein
MSEVSMRGQNGVGLLLPATREGIRPRPRGATVEITASAANWWAAGSEGGWRGRDRETVSRQVPARLVFKPMFTVATGRAQFTV